MSNDPSDDSHTRQGPPGPWIVRGMAPAVAAQAEREAARRNMELGRWLEEAIEHALRTGT